MGQKTFDGLMLLLPLATAAVLLTLALTGQL